MHMEGDPKKMQDFSQGKGREKTKLKWGGGGKELHDAFFRFG